MSIFVFIFLYGNISFLHSTISMFYGCRFRNNGVRFVGLYFRWFFCCRFYIITVAVNFIVIIIVIRVSIIIVVIIIILALFICFTLVLMLLLLPIFIIKAEHCTTRTLNDLVPCSRAIQSYMTFKTKFVQRNIVN